MIPCFTLTYGDFANDPLYLGYTSAEQENPILSIFHFHRPIQNQIELGFR
jgi:hypothetical protein